MEKASTDTPEGNYCSDRKPTDEDIDDECRTSTSGSLGGNRAAQTLETVEAAYARLVRSNSVLQSRILLQLMCRVWTD